MKKAIIVTLVGLLTAAMAQKFSVEAWTGFYGGLGGQLALVVEDLAPGLPLGVRLGAGFATSDALDDSVEYPLLSGIKWGDYKKNNKLNEEGQNVTLSLDVLYKMGKQVGLPVELAPYLGVRYNLFSGGHTDPENNVPVKSFTVTSNQLGFGGGVRLAYPLMTNLSLVGDLGVDYYLNACLFTVIVPDSGDIDTIRLTICPGDRVYDDLDESVTQPNLVFKLRLGAAYRF